MAKKKADQPDPKAATLARIKRTEAYAERVRLLFATTVNQILALNKTLPKLAEGEMFSFDGQSIKKQREVERLLRQLHSVATMAIQHGISLEWSQANAEADKLVNSIYGQAVLSNPTFKAWTSRNGSAMDAFINRSEKGLNLSDRVWKAVRQLRDEMEVAITISIGEGKSAQRMSQDVREYLNDPDLMFRRFRYKAGEEDVLDEDGNVVGTKPIYKKKWKKRIRKPDGTYGFVDCDRDTYKTGAGVYKSSAKNAMRVTRTETNIAYRRADHERWQAMDFVIGQRVQLSRSHPKKDICDKLAGDYPKDFIFDGWHPQCFCYVTPITLPIDDMTRISQMMANGEDWRAELARLKQAKSIKDYPDNFKQWVADNADNIEAARDRGTEPYFIRNNARAINKILYPKPEEELTPLQRAEKRHEERTPEQAEAIRLKWQERQERIASEKKKAHISVVTSKYGGGILSVMKDIPGVDTSALRDAIAKGDVTLIQEEAKKLRLLGKQFKADAHSALGTAATYDDVSRVALEAAIKAGNIKAIWQETKELQKRIDAKQAIQISSIDTDAIPEMQYNSKQPKQLAERFDNLMRGVKYYFGESYFVYKFFSPKIGNLDEAEAKRLLKLVEQSITGDEILQFTAIEHLMELRNNSANSIPKAWHERFNQLIQQINAHDCSTGIHPIVHKIEEAHNMLQLSKNKLAKEFELDNLSTKTPYQIFTEFEKMIPGFSKHCPKKEFFDSFSEFIPLYTKEHGTSVGAYFSPSKKHVVINLSNKDNIQRFKNSEWYRDGLFYHEYGHAYDHVNGLRTDQEMIDLFEDWRNEVLKDNGASLKASILAELKPRQDAFQDYWKNSERKKQLDKECSDALDAKDLESFNKASRKRAKAYSEEYSKWMCDLEEQVGAVSDCLGGLLGGTAAAEFFAPRCHDKKYFSNTSSQYAEFIAHCSENYWRGNPYFKKLAPTIYKLTKAYIQNNLLKFNP